MFIPAMVPEKEYKIKELKRKEMNQIVAKETNEEASKIIDQDKLCSWNGIEKLTEMKAKEKGGNKKRLSQE